MIRERRSDLAPWETVERRLAADASPWLKLWQETVRLPDGRIIPDYYTIEHADYAVVYAIQKDGRVLVQWRYKHGPRNVNLGLPAGFVEKGEEPLAAAKRELLEETGRQASRWTRLGSFATDGNRGGGHAHVFLAEETTQIQEPNPDDLEDMCLELVTADELRQHLRAGAVGTLGAAAAIAMGLDAHSTM